MMALPIARNCASFQENASKTAGVLKATADRWLLAIHSAWSYRWVVYASSPATSRRCRGANPPSNSSQSSDRLASMKRRRYSLHSGSSFQIDPLKNAYVGDDVTGS